VLDVGAAEKNGAVSFLAAGWLGQRRGGRCWIELPRAREECHSRALELQLSKNAIVDGDPGEMDLGDLSTLLWRMV